MNYLHQVLCSSARWKDVVQRYALPWTLEQIDLGSEVLEIGPGYGAATEVLQRQVRHLLCVESDRKLARRLDRKFNGLVTVRCEDATAMSFANRTFQSAVCFTMLHHVGSIELQNKLFREVARVLKPGGIFAGTDSLPGRSMKFLHLFDTLVLVDPETLAERLTDAGFENAQVDVNPYAFRFRAWKP
ncbi:MAG TPA: class I SAM-dependent methyltransferase [Terracidiphilus sp.]|nr:class I SAM-dependent methyltransferase [Terracidiphilus sp.]